MTVHDPDLAAIDDFPPVPLEPAPATEIEAGGILTIDLAAIEANWKKLAAMTLPVECAAVVKADAYGCGIEPVVTRLEGAGCKTYFVADVAEGRRVRAIAPSATIYVLNGLMPGSAQSFADARLRPVISSTTELAEWDAFVSVRKWREGAALHVDTGINRLGITLDEAAAIAPRIQSENHGFTLLMSHFACAEAPDHALNDRQIRWFREVRIMYRGLPSSIANSAGIFLGGTVYCDLVRPGGALFGANPTPGRKNPMRPVVDLKGRIVQVRNLKKGDSVGYHATWTATRPSRIAVVAIGYADGFLRAGSASKDKPAAQVVVAGKRCPIVGRVSMDLFGVDVTDLAEGMVYRGSMATLLGEGITVDDLAPSLGTIGYEVLTSLGRRYHRVYKGL